MFATIVNKGAEPVKWLLIIGIAYTLATLVWSFFDTPITPASITSDSAVKTANSRPAANVNWILGKHLFGEAGVAPVETVSNEPVQQTRLPLELQGTFMADEKELSSAIVAQRGKPGKSYTVGDTLPGNAKLDEVFNDRIILVRAGARETLPFPKNTTQFVPEDYVLEDDSPMSESTDETTLSDADTADPVESESSPEETVEAYRERLAADPAAALNELGVESVDGGGYRIGNLAQNPLFRNTGLQSGDVILSVNGQPVGDVSQDQLEIDSIMAQGTARIEVQRGDRRFFITASLP